MKIKHLFLAFVFCIPASFALATDPPKDSLDAAPTNWFNLDAENYYVQGVSTEKAYDFLKGRNSKKVIVAVIDSGVDIEHEDLQGKVWVNTDEIPGNGKDDDGNGYVDDVNGWNFIGGTDGSNVDHDTYEVTREYVKLKKKYEGVSLEDIPKKERAYYEEIMTSYEQKRAEMEQQYSGFKFFAESYNRSSKLLEAYLDVEEVTMDALQEINSEDEIVQTSISIMEYALSMGFSKEQFEEYEEHYSSALEYGYNPEFDPRHIVGDNYEDVSEKYYGNNDVNGPDSNHGTHVAGIIAANRGNQLGMEGIAENVEIMAIRAVPNGDERDKDIANAIYYAVDNGAKVINMSFGKSYSPEKEAVDKAVKYAESKGVLLVHAAGNSSDDIDQVSNFPTRQYESSKKVATNWIEVGASSWKGEENFVAEFSNYGKKSVDVFAPGVDLYSTTPNQKYQSNSGTSMASPVTAGIAALVMSYYPDLKAEQIKQIILDSTVKFEKLKVNRPGEEGKLVNFESLSTTGGVVNAYEAVKLAESYQIKRESK
ncbi:S8 family peptidase [Catalinimonas niigatensis]|uniref:S8 family peptidase n=1 Tax=Catalinimonas niigatensis TaxID=1397264 RepID=UPI002666AE41|nr:S8 family peptidase [Catalinimonas niigatensis]WPP51292.1 S8 family peptidase [Catalinimonas niigatensis]